jgi:hypothetical protein
MSADCDTRRWFFADGVIKLHAMGRNTTVGSLPHYREVLVTNAVRAVRDSFPAVQAFAAERRAWIAQSAVQSGWRAVAIAAGAIADQATTR